MSENLAEKLKRQVYGRKVTGYILLFAISMVFVFFGYTGSQGTLGIGAVARVNDTLISLAEFQNEENRIQQYYSSLFGGSMDFGPQRQMLKQQAMENLIRSELVAQAARREGILATDAEIRDFIVKEIPFFQENGQFQRERYMGYLEATRSTPGDFESKVRKDIQNLRTRRLIEAATLPLNLEIQKLQALQGLQLNVAFLRLEPEEAAKKIRIPTETVAAKMADESFKKRVADHFQATKSDYGRQEEAKVQHLLIGFKPGDPASEKAALEKAQDLRQRADKEDFGALAAKFSEDPGSKEKKGMLEPFGRGRMVKEFEDASFSQKIGELSQPVKSPFGYHLIKVLSRTEAEEAKLDEVSVQVAQKLLARDRAEEGFKKIEELVAKGDLSALEAEVRDLGLSWEETGFFDLAADGVPKLPPGAVSEAVFEVTEKAPLLGRVVRESGARFVLKYKGQKSESVAQAKLGDVDFLRRRRAEGVYNSWLNQNRQRSHVEMNPQVLQ